MPVLVVVVVAVAVTVTVATLKKVLVTLNVSVSPLPVTVNVFVENFVTVDQRATDLVSVGVTVMVVVGPTLLVFVTVSVLTLATDLVPSSVRQLTSLAAEAETARRGRRAVEKRVVFMMTLERIRGGLGRGRLRERDGCLGV